MLASFHPVIAEIFSFKKLPDKWVAEEGVAPERAAGLHFCVRNLSVQSACHSNVGAEATIIITTIREDINLIYLLRMQNNVHELLQFDIVQKKERNVLGQGLLIENADPLP